jgi:hypothetical protein
MALNEKVRGVWAATDTAPATASVSPRKAAPNLTFFMENHLTDAWTWEFARESA